MNKLLFIFGCISICMTNLATASSEEKGRTMKNGYHMRERDTSFNMKRYMVIAGEPNGKVNEDKNIQYRCKQFERISEDRNRNDDISNYASQMRNLCYRLGKDKFKQGDALILYSGEASLNKSDLIIYRMVQYVANGSNEIQCRMYGKTRDDQWMKAYVIWFIGENLEVQVKVTKYILLADSTKNNGEDSSSQLEKLQNLLEEHKKYYEYLLTTELNRPYLKSNDILGMKRYTLTKTSEKIPETVAEAYAKFFIIESGYKEQREKMIDTLNKGDNNRRFQLGDTLMVYTGRSPVGKGIMYEMVQFVEKGSYNIETRVFGIKKGSYRRYELDWYLSHGNMHVKVNKFTQLRSENDIDTVGDNDDEQNSNKNNLKNVLEKPVLNPVRAIYKEILMNLGALYIWPLPGALNTTMVCGDNTNFVETCKKLSRASGCEQEYENQVDDMCRSFHENPEYEVFGKGDSLMFLCGKYEILNANFLRMIKYIKGGSYKLISRGFAKVTNSEKYVRTQQDWQVLPCAQKSHFYSGRGIEGIDFSEKIFVLNNAEVFKGPRNADYEKKKRDISHTKVYYNYYASLFNAARICKI